MNQRSIITAPQLARQSLEYYFANQEMMPVPGDLSAEFCRKAGVFVSLKKHGRLRGCIGTFVGTRESVAAEIIANAIQAGLHDPRFLPLKKEELPELDISVDVLEEPEAVDGMEMLDPKEYGVIVRSGHRSGLLLPDLEGVDQVTDQVAIAMEKAGIQPHEPIQLYRFRVTRYK